MSQSVALLIRGLNVGAHNRIKMNVLVDLLAGSGFESIETYIQSGNVRLSSGHSPAETAAIAEQTFERHFQKKVVVVATPWDRLTRLVTLELFSAEDRIHHKGIAVFLKGPSDAAQSLIGEHGPLRILRAEKDVLIGLVKKGETHALDFKKLIERPLGTPVTARFWNVIEDWVHKYE